MAAIAVGASSSPYTAILFLVITALILRLKIGTLVGSWFCFTLIIVYLGGIIVIFAYLSKLVLPVKINLLRSSIVLAGLFFLRGPIKAKGSPFKPNKPRNFNGFRV